MKLPFQLDQIDTEEFNIRPVDINGETCHLIFPRAVGPKWTKDNLILRSSLWNSEGWLISAGFKKFFNYNEAPHIVPDPTTLDDASAYEKIDGSLLIFSRYRGQDIFRTRGTVDARKMDNGAEIDLLIAKYPDFFSEYQKLEYTGYSFLFEWVSPANQIVIFYPEADIKLVGIVNHRNYSYVNQLNLDAFAETYNLKRPTRYTFNTVEELYTSVKAFEGKEGICLYYNGDQNIKKFKGLDYLAKHSFMSKVSNKETINLFMVLGCPSYEDFYNYLLVQFDFEIAEYAKPFLDNVYAAYDKYLNLKNDIYTEWEAQGWNYMSRKDAANSIMNGPYKQYSALAFNLLDGKEISNEQIRKFLCLECGVNPKG